MFQLFSDMQTPRYLFFPLPFKTHLLTVSVRVFFYFLGNPLVKAVLWFSDLITDLNFDYTSVYRIFALVSYCIKSVCSP